MHFSLSSQTFSSFYSFVNSTLKLFSSFFCNGCWQLPFILCTITSESLWHLTLLMLTVGCRLPLPRLLGFCSLKYEFQGRELVSTDYDSAINNLGFLKHKDILGKKSQILKLICVLPLICTGKVIERSMTPPSHFTLNSHFHSNASWNDWTLTTKNCYKLVWYRIVVECKSCLYYQAVNSILWRCMVDYWYQLG